MVRRARQGRDDAMQSRGGVRKDGKGARATTKKFREKQRSSTDARDKYGNDSRYKSERADTERRDSKSRQFRSRGSRHASGRSREHASRGRVRESEEDRRWQLRATESREPESSSDSSSTLSLEWVEEGVLGSLVSWIGARSSSYSADSSDPPFEIIAPERNDPMKRDALPRSGNSFQTKPRNTTMGSVS